MNAKTEPVRVAALIQTLIVAVIALVTAFGVTVTQAQAAAILGAVTAVSAIVVAVIVRGKVTPTGQ